MATTTLKKWIGPVRDLRTRFERRIFELSKGCPVDGSNPVLCPLCGLRLLSARERRAWIHGLSDDELEYLATYHSCCHALKKTARRC